MIQESHTDRRESVNLGTQAYPVAPWRSYERLSRRRCTSRSWLIERLPLHDLSFCEPFACGFDGSRARTEPFGRDAVVRFAIVAGQLNDANAIMPTFDQYRRPLREVVTFEHAPDQGNQRRREHRARPCGLQEFNGCPDEHDAQRGVDDFVTAKFRRVGRADRERSVHLPVYGRQRRKVNARKPELKSHIAPASLPADRPAIGGRCKSFVKDNLALRRSAGSMVGQCLRFA